MNPTEIQDATVSFDDIPLPPAQHAHGADYAAVGSTDGVHPMCHACERWIYSHSVRALAHTWHTRCFVCTRCETPLEHVSFYEHNGRPYCALDFHELFARRCFHCQTPIVDERFVTIDDPRLGQRSYHELHFFCAGCGDPFLDPAELPSPRLDTEQAPSEDTYTGKPFFVRGSYPYCHQVRPHPYPVPPASACTALPRMHQPD